MLIGGQTMCNAQSDRDVTTHIARELSALLLYTSLAAPGYARAHRYLSLAMLAEYAAPWPVALACTPVRSRSPEPCLRSFPLGAANAGPCGRC